MLLTIEETNYYQYILNDSDREILVEDYTKAMDRACSFGSDCAICDRIIKTVHYIIDLENKSRNVDRKLRLVLEYFDNMPFSLEDVIPDFYDKD